MKSKTLESYVFEWYVRIINFTTQSSFPSYTYHEFFTHFDTKRVNIIIITIKNRDAKTLNPIIIDYYVFKWVWDLIIRSELTIWIYRTIISS